MVQVFEALSKTSAPSLLMGLGGVLLLLAFVNKIGTHIELPEKRQRLAAIVGSLLLLFGMTVAIVPQIGGRSASSTPKDARQAPGELERASEKRTQAAAMSKLENTEGKTGSSIADEKSGRADALSDGALGPNYQGPLERLLPNESLLPPFVFSETVERTPEDWLRSEGSKDRSATMRLLTKPGFASLTKRYDRAYTGCALVATIKPGQIVMVFASVLRFETPQDARQYWELWKPKYSDATQALGSWHEQYPSGVFESYGTCGSASILWHYRTIVVGNIKFWVGLGTSPESAGDPEISELSRLLVQTMADSLPGMEI